MAGNGGKLGRWLSGLSLLLAILVGIPSVAQAEPRLIVLASSEFTGTVFDGVPVSDDVLARMQGKGAEGPDIGFSDVTGVVLWDEVVGPKGGGTPGSGATGVGNVQSNSLQHQ